MDAPMKSKGRIVMLANAGHKPLDTRIFHKEAVSLSHAGWDVTLIIPHSESFEQNGVKIVAVPLPTKGWQQLIRCPWDIFRRAMKLPADSIFHIHDSELLVAGLALKLFGRKVVYDAHEDTPLQISYQHWIPSLLKKPYELFYRLLEKMAGWWFNHIIVAEPVIAKYFPPRKVSLIRNFPIAASFESITPYETRKDNMVYVGLLSKARGVVEMLKAHALAIQSVPVGFIVGGKFAPASLEAELLPHHSIDYRKWLSYDEMIKVLNASRIGIIVPHPIERYKTNFPVKLFEYMAAGLPVIASREGVSSDFVREGEAGLLVDPNNVEEIAKAIIQLMNHPDEARRMGERGRRLIVDKYNWEREFQTLDQLYQTLALQ